MNLLLALDASSTVIGYSIWDIKLKKLIKLDYFKFVTNNFLDKSNQYNNFLKELLSKYNISKMIIEESFEIFAFGKSSSHVIATLAKINAVIQYITYSYNIQVETISVSKSRKLAFPDVILHQKKHSNNLTHKEQMFLVVKNEIGNNYFPTKIISRGKNKGKVEFEDWCYDMSDAYVIGKGYLKIINENKNYL